MSRLLQTFAFLLFSISLISTAFAHYLWLDGSEDSSGEQTIFNIDIRLGDDLSAQSLVNDLSQYEIFDVYREKTSKYVSGERGRLPAGYIEDDGNPFAVYYRSISRKLVMNQADFLRHLVVEGLRQQFEDYDTVGRPAEITESYTHHAMLRVDQPILPIDNLELSEAFLLRPDFEQTPGGQNSPAHFQLTFQGQPIADAPVTLRCADRSQPTKRLYTSSEGRVVFDRLCSGTSLLHSIYLRDLEQTGTRWESQWLSLTLQQR